MDSICCPCCQIGRQCGSVEDGTVNQMQCCGCLCGLLFPACSICCLRRKVSTKFNMSEGCCGALCCTFFCPACSLCQTHRELTARGFWPGGFCCSTQPATAAPIAPAPVQ
jgi:Cys-rich protein (TIGR01571 family)